jgi:SH3 domain-containing YSC84-like protein 1
MSGEWGAPVMYALDQGSIGVQLGSTATDFVLVVVDDKGVDAKTKNEEELAAPVAALPVLFPGVAWRTCTPVSQRHAQT